jgi:hypothetical protein
VGDILSAEELEDDYDPDHEGQHFESFVSIQAESGETDTHSNVGKLLAELEYATLSHVVPDPVEEISLLRSLK